MEKESLELLEKFKGKTISEVKEIGSSMEPDSASEATFALLKSISEHINAIGDLMKDYKGLCSLIDMGVIFVMASTGDVDIQGILGAPKGIEVAARAIPDMLREAQQELNSKKKE